MFLSVYFMRGEMVSSCVHTPSTFSDAPHATPFNSHFLAICIRYGLFCAYLQSLKKMTFTISDARAHFPALQQDQVFLDNAGGSQALGEVIDS